MQLPAGQCAPAAGPLRPQRWRGRAAVPPAAASSYGASGTGRAEELAAAVAAKERELQQMFEPGRVAKVHLAGGGVRGASLP